MTGGVCMAVSRWILAGLVGLVLQVTASAQIYESKDAEGVPQFSDRPTAGAEVVDLPATNLADAPPAREPAPATEPRRAAPAGSGTAGVEPAPAEAAYGGVYYDDDDENDPHARPIAHRKRVETALQGGDAPQAGEPGDPAREAGEVRRGAPHAVHRNAGGHR